MPANRTANSNRPRRPSLIHNWISLGGIILAACSLFAFACLFAMDSFQATKNPYLGILTFLVAPAFLILGLLLIAGGALWERRRRRRLAPGQIPEFPRIDMNVPRQRHTLIAVALVTFALLLLTALGSYRTYHYTESVAFCGRLCHSVMKPEYTAHQLSPHARVACVRCHIGPSAGWYVKSKISGAYQVWATVFNKYSRPIPAPINSLRPIRLDCEQCHWPNKFYGKIERVWNHYLPDKTNTDWTIRMLVKIDGGDPRFGPVGGIHWHMAVGTKVEYISTSTNLQTIPWVRLTDAHGKVTVYQTENNSLKPSQVAAATIHVIDCVDCHNRPTHNYHAPIYSVDLAMSTGRISTNLPHIKRRAIEALTAKYTDSIVALSGISRALTTYYQSNYPGLAHTNSALITQAVAAVQSIYQYNFFPGMKVDWRVYPNNIGHLYFPGCFRCHDGEHLAADGARITHDCRACHLIVAQGPDAALSMLSLAGLNFKHPEDIGGMWKEYNCDFCHTGDLAD